ncbi:TetR/AcrR family transcriptional regulator [Rhodococcus erythropolis]|uniref:TetR/AcrR family transcriptional regulator n=1 Tax=Rhodococcus erythropolis TaxID=1833 RepID=UPI002225C849|nr:TetR/AcrR family transcriptional regulator [Rhodococcus erythropolis]MCW2295499.1 AcrR family transcriptional regulator [Rhodococcus erythropolis]
MTEKVAVTGLAGIRSRTSSLQNPRSGRTRDRIREAARTLAASGSPVNVKTVAKATGISRGTFYSHYARLDELAADILTEGIQSRPFSIEALVDLYLQYRDFYRRALQETTSRGVLEGAVEITVEAMVAQVDGAVGQEQGSLEVLARFTAWGYLGTLDWWLREDEPLSSATLTTFLRERTPAVFAGHSD